MDFRLLTQDDLEKEFTPEDFGWNPMDCLNATQTGCIEPDPIRKIILDTLNGCRDLILAPTRTKTNNRISDWMFDQSIPEPLKMGALKTINEIIPASYFKNGETNGND